MFQLLQSTIACLALAASGVVGQAAPPAVTDSGVAAWPFDFTQVQLTTGRFAENQNRTLTYLKFVDLNRMLYVFRSNHKLSTNGAQANGGWDAPSFPFRSHVQGHFLSAWAQCYGSLGDTECQSRAQTFTSELAKCQANNAAAGFATGYLSGFPESEFTALEQGKLTDGNVPWYVVHKLMAGLLDVWRHIGDANAKTVLLNLAAWVDTRTGKLSSSQMQSVLNTEFGGMPEVLTDLYFQTGNKNWITVAQRFDHAAVLNPLASGQDQLNGLHGNTQIPKWIGAAREFKATGTARYATIARNAWNFVTTAHAYAMGGFTEAEHFHGPNQIAGYLDSDTAESCDTYNLLKLTRELWVMNTTNAAYFEYYERALFNQMLGQQNPSDSHGHITYFNSLNPGGVRGLGPAWGGGTWSTDYNSFWCCQGSGLEVQTSHMDSIYFYDNSSLYVNLFISSTLKYAARGVTVTQSTNFPVSDQTTLTISGTSTGTWSLKIRIPQWATGATVTVNGAAVSGVTASPGSYATITRAWASGDTVQVTLPMALNLIKANDNAGLAAVAYGPVVLVGNYGSQSVGSAPTLTLSSIARASTSALTFTGTASGKSVNLVPWYDGQGFNYVTYWTTSGSL